MRKERKKEETKERKKEPEKKRKMGVKSERKEQEGKSGRRRARRNESE